MNFSLVLPSRERLPLLEGLLTSVKNNTADIDELEAWVAVDWDDGNTISSINTISKQFPFVKFLATDRQNNLSVGYYNRLGTISCGKYIQVLNDDCEFVTPRWDEKALEVLKKYQNRHPDGILYGRTVDNGNYGYSCFPLISRQAFNALGWIFHPEMTAWGADDHLHRVFFEVGRVVDMPYNIKHLSHHNGNRERDDINKRMGSISKYNFGSAGGEANRLRNIIIALDSKPILF